METPQSISVIGREEIRDQNPVNLAEALHYAPGVEAGTFGADTRNEDIDLAAGLFAALAEGRLNGFISTRRSIPIVIMRYFGARQKRNGRSRTATNRQRLTSSSCGRDAWNSAGS